MFLDIYRISPAALEIFLYTLLSFLYVWPADYVPRSYIYLKNALLIIYSYLGDIYLSEKPCKLLRHLHPREDLHEKLCLLRIFISAAGSRSIHRLLRLRRHFRLSAFSYCHILRSAISHVTCSIFFSISFFLISIRCTLMLHIRVHLLLIHLALVHLVHVHLLLVYLALIHLLLRHLSFIIHLRLHLVCVHLIYIFLFPNTIFVVQSLLTPIV